MLLIFSAVPRLDRVQFVERLRPGAPSVAQHEVYAAHFEPAGHGLVALRVARALGVQAKLVAARGGATGALVEEALASEGVTASWVRLDAPTPMGVVHCGCDELGAPRRESWVEPQPRLGDAELRKLLALFDREAEAADAVLLPEPAREGPIGIAVIEVARRARARNLPWILLSSRPSQELLELEPALIVEDARDAEYRHSPADWTLPAGCRAWLRATVDAQLLLLGTQGSQQLLEILMPEAPDRGGEAPFEAAAVGCLLKEAQHWPTRAAACWGLAAAAAQKLKELGGRLALSEIDGFYAQVRAQQVDRTAS